MILHYLRFIENLFTNLCLFMSSQLELIIKQPFPILCSVYNISHTFSSNNFVLDEWHYDRFDQVAHQQSVTLWRKT